nr:unnamed protein product [Digitaria exilis]CAB3505126.1 unnamed protein product [Digitaria exilis]
MLAIGRGEISGRCGASSGRRQPWKPFPRGTGRRGFGSSLLALDKKTYELAGENTPGNAPGSYKEPAIGWMTGFLLAISFVGLLNLLPLRKKSQKPII